MGDGFVIAATGRKTINVMLLFVPAFVAKNFILLQAAILKFSFMSGITLCESRKSHFKIINIIAQTK